MLCAVVSLLIPNEYAILRPGLAPFPYTEPPASSLRAVASSPPASHPLPPGRRRCGPVARSLAGPGMRGWPLNRTGPSGLRDSCRTREDKAARSGVGPSDRLRRALRTGPEPRPSTRGNAYGAGGGGRGQATARESPWDPLVCTSTRREINRPRLLGRSAPGRGVWGVWRWPIFCWTRKRFSVLPWLILNVPSRGNITFMT